MRLRGTKMTLQGAEGESSPPLPYIEVEQTEGEVLLALYPKSIVEVDEDGSAIDRTAPVPDPLASPEPEAEVEITATDEESDPGFLIGSDSWPALIAIGEGEVQLGEVVRAACSDMTSTEWNALDGVVRDGLITFEVHDLRIKAGRDPDTNEVPTPAEPETPAAPAEGAGEPASEDAANDTPAGSEGADTADAHAGEHADDMIEAFELLGDDDLVKTGDRAGRPKVNVVKEILDREVTAEEIDAAWAARAPAA